MLLIFKSALAFFFLFSLHGTSIENGQQGITHNGSGIAEGRDLEVESFNLPQKPDSSTNVQLTTSAPIAQNTCYGLPFFQDIALGGLCKTHNLYYVR